MSRPDGEGDRLDHDTVGRAGQPPQHGADLDLPQPQIEMPPPRRHRTGVVTGRRLVTTVRHHSRRRRNTTVTSTSLVNHSTAVTLR
jgi:hypothetical protein